jgi:hypothetical protein
MNRAEGKREGIGARKIKEREKKGIEEREESW